MRLQRYPDGNAKWMLTLWSRHPEGSLTWTHTLFLLRRRDGWMWRPRLIWDGIGSQRGRGVAWLCFLLELKVQDKLLWRTVYENAEDRHRERERAAFERGRQAGRRDVFRGVGRDQQ